MYLDIVYIYVHCKSYVSRKVKTSYNLGRIEYIKKMLPGYACSGPSRFDWDVATNGWIYKRTGANLVQLLEKEIGELCRTPVELS
jgi:hypothetical protein